MIHNPGTHVQNSLYTLHGTDCQLILSPSGWLNNKIIHASQMLLTQRLEPPTLEQIQRFQLHFGEFIQLLNVRNSHWIVVSNLRCDKDVVNLYDTTYPSIPSSTTDTIAPCNTHNQHGRPIPTEQFLRLQCSQFGYRL